MILNIHMTCAIIIQSHVTSLYLWYTQSDNGSDTHTHKEKMSLCHAKHHVSAILWNILKTSESRRFTEIKSSIKILARFLTYYSYTRHASSLSLGPGCCLEHVPGYQILSIAYLYEARDQCAAASGLKAGFLLSASTVIHFPVFWLHRDSDREFASSTAHYGWKT